MESSSGSTDLGLMGSLGLGFGRALGMRKGEMKRLGLLWSGWVRVLVRVSELGKRVGD